MISFQWICAVTTPLQVHRSRGAQEGTEERVRGSFHLGLAAVVYVAVPWTTETLVSAPAPL